MTDRVTIDDCRKAGFCVAGIRTACANLGLDFRRLVREGLPIEEVEAVADRNVERVLRKTKERIG